MTIRWGVSPIAWCNDDMRELGGDTTLDELLADVRDIGFDGVELGNKFPRDPELLAPIMANYGLDIVGGWYSSNLLVRDADAEIEALSKHLALLEYMDSSVFILAETSNAVHCDRYGSRLDTHPVLPAADWKQFGERLDTVARFINDRGLRFAYHHHLGTVVETKDELERFFDATGDHVGLVLDTGHALFGGIEPVDVIKARPERVAHVHCKDVRTAKYDEFRASGTSFLNGVVGGMFTAPGDGDYDYAPFMRALADMHYSGWIVIEAEQDPAIANPREYSQLGLDTLKRLAREEALV
ncbi:myo-inosose-2 dehydratase [Sphingopyxis granuli]|uniref:myo-inosose-2 dehydratase n=1 Tax=Sphingopyxis TaxID=165697 RepID=UPI00086F06F4|nr:MULTISPECIES: myo-inosose-2 dehydratase [Sphingopyxis]AVA15629.1 myo-inosose-2 dehydratase [Sphingopyxis sp. MG]ODU33690.1 MAG: myo-inosose-2 dehydratase [Sphingopyxis sp. SCN 67-31]UNK79816.1 myo-inosose-2 dehydratase [Sphingopyxis granuli]